MSETVGSAHQGTSCWAAEQTCRQSAHHLRQAILRVTPRNLPKNKGYELPPKGIPASLLLDSGHWFRSKAILHSVSLCVVPRLQTIANNCVVMCLSTLLKIHEHPICNLESGQNFWHNRKIRAVNYALCTLHHEYKKVCLLFNLHELCLKFRHVINMTEESFVLLYINIILSHYFIFNCLFIFSHAFIFISSWYFIWGLSFQNSISCIFII